MKNIKFNTDEIKYKPLSLDRLIISFDRLTRFKHTEEKYLRVFCDILTNNLIYPKLKKQDLENFDYKVLTQIAEYIINQSISEINKNLCVTNYSVNKKLKDYEKSIFKFDKNTEEMLDNKINYDALIRLLPDDVPLNLKWLKLLIKPDNTARESYLNGFHFPIKKLVICEGLTEEILLPVFADVLGYNFDNNGIQIISAGGKNQVVKMFYKYADTLKLPVFILLDSDANSNYQEILPKLRKQDKVHLISCGEFEDILPLSLIEKALKYSVENISQTPEKEPAASGSMVEYLEEFYKTRGVHEFKKAEFAQIVKKNISGIDDVSSEFKVIINEIENL